MSVRINLNLALKPKSKEQVKQRLELTTARVEAELRSRQAQPDSSGGPQTVVVKRIKTQRKTNTATSVNPGERKRIV